MKTRLPLVLFALSLLSGCGGARYLAYLFAPGGGAQTVQPEFDELPGKTVAVVVFADYQVQYEYPTAQLDVSALVGEQMRKNVKDVKIIDPRQIARYMGENVRWDTMPKTQLAKELNADCVLLVSLVEYSTREPDTQNLYRGRISAEATIYDAALPEQQCRRWNASVGVIFPEDAPGGVLAENDSAIRYQTNLVFADSLAKKFYKHKVMNEE